jgi:hypothetical protein
MTEIHLVFTQYDVPKGYWILFLVHFQKVQSEVCSSDPHPVLLYIVLLTAVEILYHFSERKKINKRDNDVSSSGSTGVSR